MYSCDGGTFAKPCKNMVNTGDSNPSIVLCKDCNYGTAIWNCVDTGNYSCDCSVCGPSGYPVTTQPDYPIEP